MIVSCPACKKRFNLDPKGASEVRLRCTACGSVFAVSAEMERETARADVGTFRVLIATDDDGIMDEIDAMLKSRNIITAKSRDGFATLDMAKRVGPQAVILDVALPGLYSFSICEEIKATPALKNVKIILLSEAFNKKRYRRKPTSLFGADDYVEKHDIGSELLPKILQMDGAGATGTKPAPPAAPPAPVAARQPAASGPATAQARQERTVAPNGELHEKSRRLARVIAADIILYNKDKLDAARGTAGVDELFKSEIEDGIKYFKQRLPAAEAARDYLNEAIRDFLNARGAKKPC